MKKSPRISVVVCVKNEEERIEKCIKSIAKNKPTEIIVVDGDSQDKTVKLAKKYTKSVIICKNSNMVRDRQIGIDAAKSPYIAMIDADHRLEPDDLESMVKDLNRFGLDAAQAQLKSYTRGSFWNQAEDQIWQLNHNIPGKRDMIGGAPTMYKKDIFKKIKFDADITKTIEDTDFCYRLSKIPGIKIGIGKTIVAQEHFSGFKDYLKKYQWYGKGDAEFIEKHPERASSMIFHLLVRYPLIYPFKAISQKKFKAPALMILQGYIRFWSLFKHLITSHEKK